MNTKYSTEVRLGEWQEIDGVQCLWVEIWNNGQLMERFPVAEGKDLEIKYDDATGLLRTDWKF